MTHTRLAELPDKTIELNRGTGAHIAMTLTRSALKRRSANKVRLKSVTIPGEDIYTPTKIKSDTMDRTIENMKIFNAEVRGSEQGQRFVSRLEQGEATWSDIQAYAAVVRSVGTGNCLEYAVVAFEKLRSDGWTTVELVQLVPPSTHCFVVLGSARHAGTHDAGFNLGKDAVICDPWAHIACDAQVYEINWNARMDKWAKEEKVICVPGSQISPREYGLRYPQRVMFSVA